MGHGIDPRSAPRRSGRRSGRRRPSTDPRTLPAVVRQRIEAHRRKAHGGRISRPEGGVAAEGGKRMEETARGTGQTGTP